MSFTITIHDVADKDLGSLLATMKLPRGADYKLTHMIDVQITGADPSFVVNGKKRKKGKKNRRGNPDIKLTMSGKRPQIPGGKIEKGLDLFEKLEGDMGIGTVSASAFIKHLNVKRVPDGMLNRLLAEGYLSYL
jgi:hypothetical protein